MASVKEIHAALNAQIPEYMKLDFDNVGILAGFCGNEVHTVLTALDITDEVIGEAVDIGAELIVSHHPLIFDALKRVTDDDLKGRKIIRLIQNGISAICMHTNLDSAEGGVNDCLMRALGAEVTGLLAPHGAHPDGSPYGVIKLFMRRLPPPFQLMNSISEPRSRDRKSVV